MQIINNCKINKLSPSTIKCRLLIDSFTINLIKLLSQHILKLSIYINSTFATNTSILLSLYIPNCTYSSSLTFILIYFNPCICFYFYSLYYLVNINLDSYYCFIVIIVQLIAALDCLHNLFVTNFILLSQQPI